MILVEGYVPNSNISPVEGVVVGVGNNNVGWTGAPVSALNAEGGGVLSIAFDGTSTDNDIAAWQCGLNGTITLGGLYRVWIKARETGNTNLASWSNQGILMQLISDAGAGHNGNLPPNYDHFWTGVTPGLTSTWTWFSAVVQIDPGRVDEWTHNSIAVSVSPIPAGAGFAQTRTLEFDAVVVEELATG